MKLKFPWRRRNRVKWREFVRKVEAAGVLPDDEVWYVEFDHAKKPEELTVIQYENMGWAIS